MKHLLAVSLLGFVAAVGSSKTVVRPAPAAEAAFGMTVTGTPTGWVARCDSGCRWTTLSFRCRTATTTCAATVDANGVFASDALRPEPSAFAFRLTRVGTGFTAEGKQGTAWSSLSWYCRSATCGGRIDALGVELLNR